MLESPPLMRSGLWPDAASLVHGQLLTPLALAAARFATAPADHLHISIAKNRSHPQHAAKEALATTEGTEDVRLDACACARVLQLLALVFIFHVFRVLEAVGLCRVCP